MRIQISQEMKLAIVTGTAPIIKKKGKKYLPYNKIEIVGEGNKGALVTLFENDTPMGSIYATGFNSTDTLTIFGLKGKFEVIIEDFERD